MSFPGGGPIEASAFWNKQAHLHCQFIGSSSRGTSLPLPKGVAPKRHKLLGTSHLIWLLFFHSPPGCRCTAQLVEYFPAWLPTSAQLVVAGRGMPFPFPTPMLLLLLPNFILFFPRPPRPHKSFLLGPGAGEPTWQKSPPIDPKASRASRRPPGQSSGQLAAARANQVKHLAPNPPHPEPFACSPSHPSPPQLHPTAGQMFRGNLSLPDSGRLRIVCTFDFGPWNRCIHSNPPPQRSWRHIL